ncbi:hypothetical protein NXZ69_21145 [Xanthomonas hortorum pv. pelargonii]|uniref:hypothetical protein n=1 Tax=Xanthomonas hortorum TaxID=56454 RepID=UPI0021CA66D8|nr:hypothetical protein [Xanthomonas hortorum]MCU1706795.1 hypothetical protein [Xanthomonas hortorum pv. pelargonii]MCU1715358.1 hypothetical protein [Xanthomonas hortorum pv. pelargonii]UXN02117.1 hypothetical protein N8D55_23080 [Xanthomonas hortorum pv. pelargonii]UXN02149.1 hypothetical protein N8D55_22880 [Xanthomonas hortorum pv. pelargonii]
MSQADYQRGLDDQRFSFQQRINRVIELRDRWILHARGETARADRLSHELARAQQHSQASTQQIASLQTKLAAAERTLADLQATSAQRITSLECELAQATENYGWIVSVVEDHGVQLRSQP